MTSAKGQGSKNFFKKLMNFLFFKFELSLKDNFNSKPTIYSFRKTLQNGSILFDFYVINQNVDTGNLEISQRKSLVK